MPPSKNRRSTSWNRKSESLNLSSFRWTILGSILLTFIFFYCSSNGRAVLKDEFSNFNSVSESIYPKPCDFKEDGIVRKILHYKPSSFDSENEREFWKQPDGQGLQACLGPSLAYKNKSIGIIKSEIYLVTVLTGGLNQMRLQTGNAVLLARILNATLIVPVFSFNVNWQDESEFADLFDVPHFRKTLANDVRILTTLPPSHLKMARAVERDPPLLATPAWYLKYFYPQIRKNHVMVLRGLDACLSIKLPSDLLKLRCKVEFEALRFAEPILSFGNKLVKRMAEKGPYLALHLRMEKDVWVHTGCLPGLSPALDKEIEDERLFHPEKMKSRSNLTFQERLVSGLCPLSLNLTIKLLKYLGASERINILLVGGKPFGEELVLKELVENFPNLYTKETLAQEGEFDPFLPHGNMLSAIDFILSLNSDVYLPTHGGNMAHSLQGHRAYNGHRKHITPNKRKLVSFFMHSQNVSDEEARMEVVKMHKESLGQPKSRLVTKKGDTIANPYPDCMCKV